MPSALETLVKILKLEQDTGYKNTAVIGGLQSFASNWARDAHNQAKKPEHHQLIDELVLNLTQYGTFEETDKRHETIKYMLGRITGRIAAPPNLPPSTYVASPPVAVEKPVVAAIKKEAAPPSAPPPPPAAAPKPARPAVVVQERNIHDDEDEDDSDYDDYPVHGDVYLASDVVDDSANIPAVLPSTTPPRRPRRENLSADDINKRLQDIQAPVTKLHKIGSKMAEKLNKLGMYAIADMLYNFPRRYDDYTRMRTLNRLQPGETVTVVGAVRSITKQQGRAGRPYLLLVVDDGTGILQVSFFGQLWLQRQFKPGGQVVLSGKVDLFKGQPNMTNPEWEMLERDNLHTRRLVPVYNLTKGLSARTMRRLIHQAVEEWSGHVPDHMPESVLDRANLADLSWSLRQIHFPESYEYLAHARTRLSFDELFLFQMAVLSTRREWQSVAADPIYVPDPWLESFLKTLPYSLTGAQWRALHDIRTDIMHEVPMNRLLQGDVGSGKTVVAATAIAMAVQHGKQAAIMTPTSILAEQHMRTISRLLHNSPDGEQIQVRLLTGNTSDSEREEIYRGLAEGEIHVVIGTHAVIQEGVQFADLGLAIIDEQHRFGVEQRGALRSKGKNPHTLVMTATPIPRTLALTLYADLDLSIIDEMPPGRTPVETRIVNTIERERAYNFIRSQLDKGRQAFIVYPLVEASEKLEEVGAAVEEYERLRALEFANYRVGLLHGRMKPAEKDEIMSAFSNHEIDVLVSTSVVEVGIDVPNASVILIESANRFGLAQLHQFRGRVGRGEHKSFCLLVADATTPEAEQRLKAMEETTDGFKLAEIDWELRGAGDLLGIRQSGLGAFQLAELMNPKLVELAQREARSVFAEDPYLQLPEHHLLAQQIQSLRDQRADVS